MKGNINVVFNERLLYILRVRIFEEFYFEFKLSIDQSMPLMAFQFENVKLLSLVPGKI